MECFTLPLYREIFLFAFLLFSCLFVHNLACVSCIIFCLFLFFIFHLFVCWIMCHYWQPESALDSGRKNKSSHKFQVIQWTWSLWLAVALVADKLAEYCNYIKGNLIKSDYRIHMRLTFHWMHRIKTMSMKSYLIASNCFSSCFPQRFAKKPRGCFFAFDSVHQHDIFLN